MGRKLSVILFLMFVSAALFAESDYMLEVQSTKKVIFVDQLGMSGIQSVNEVLMTLPELIYRGDKSGSLYPNYNVQIDGREVGNARDVILEQTRLAEVESIEISTSPTASEQNNGMGGSINIKLKPLAKEGVSGNVMLDASLMWDVQPVALVNYKKNKVQIRSGLFMEYYRPTLHESSFQETPRITTNCYDTLRNSYKQETAKFNFDYNPTSRDEFKVYLMESYFRRNTNTHSAFNDLVLNETVKPAVLDYALYEKHRHAETTDDHAQGLDVMALALYKHKYATGGELNMDVNYQYAPAWQKKTTVMRTLDEVAMVGGDRMFGSDLDNHSHQVAFNFKTKHPLLPAQSLHQLTMEVGANASYGFGTNFSCEYQYGDIKPIFDTATNANTTLYASPFVEWDYKYNGWHIVLGGRYQYYRKNYNLDNKASLSFTDSHTWTGNVSVSWQIKDHHFLRATGARNIVRGYKADAVTIYPYYDTDLTYIFDWQDERSFVETSAALHYIYGKLPDGESGTINAGAQLFFRRGIFSMAFAGNLYMKEQFLTSGNQWHIYFNLSWLPVLNFPKQWTLSGKLIYHSPISSWNATYGDCVYGQLRLSKQFGNWDVHAEWDDLLNYETFDQVSSPEGVVNKTNYHMYNRCLTLGFGYKF